MSNKYEYIWPDWKDSGRTITVEIGGKLISGILYADDEFFTGEDEVPIFIVKTKDNKQYPFVEADKWWIGDFPKKEYVYPDPL